MVFFHSNLGRKFSFENVKLLTSRVCVCTHVSKEVGYNGSSVCIKSVVQQISTCSFFYLNYKCCKFLVLVHDLFFNLKLVF